MSYSTWDYSYQVGGLEENIARAKAMHKRWRGREPLVVTISENGGTLTCSDGELISGKVVYCIAAEQAAAEKEGA